jgi:hypothetical protein
MAFLGTNLLVFYLTIELNELDKVITDVSDILLKRYAPDDEK